MDRHNECHILEDDKLDRDWRDNVSIGGQYAKTSPEALGALAKFQGTWEKRFSRIYKARHRIELDSPDVRLINSTSSCPGPKVRDSKERKSKNVLRVNVLEPAQSRWASEITFAAKIDGSQRFCIAYCKLNAVAVNDVSLVPQMDEYLDDLCEMTSS